MRSPPSWAVAGRGSFTAAMSGIVRWLPDAPAIFTVSLARGCEDDTVSVAVDRCVTIAAKPEEIS
jgi:hypothetical protein